MPNLAKHKFCTGCLACKDSCPQNAIKIVLENGLTYVAVDSSLCVNCRKCERVCPIVNPVRKNGLFDIRAYGGWAKDVELRRNGASGGAFAGLAQGFVRQHRGNVAVYGASLRDNSVKHTRITEESEIHFLMNSKYIQSATEGVFRLVKEDLSHRRWTMFSGTPCQIAALYGFLGNKRDDERLITVEIVCHGVPGKEALDIHLEHFKSSKIYSFRNKEEGQKWYTSQCTTIERNGKPYRFKRRDDVFYKIFSGWLLDRKSCSNCLYATINRVADITLADFWGGAKSPQEYDDGVNLIMANNAKAEEYLRTSSEIEIYGTTLEKAISGNPCIYEGYKYIQYHPLVVWPNFFRKVLPRKIWLNIIENNMPFKLIWAPFKILTKVRQKRTKKKLLGAYGSFFAKWFVQERY